jgi:ABC-type xylose transport system permease subunit
MPTGDSPKTVNDYIHFLQSHHETNGQLVTWHINWDSIGWVYGILAMIVIALILWVWQYRTTSRRTGLYPVDRWGGFTTESARPATTVFFVYVLAVTVGIDIVVIVGHLLWGQTY